MSSTIFRFTASVAILISLDCTPYTHANSGRIVSQSNSAVGSKLYNVLATKDSKNILISPFSLSYALAALYIGTEGKSYDELAQVLNLPKDSDSVKNAFKDITSSLKNDKNITIATKLFIDNTFQVKEKYKQDIAEYFSSAIGQSDFKNNSEVERKEINKWVEDNTNKRIKDLLPQGSITTDTGAVLVNAVHFKSDWLYPFDKDLTQSGTFYGLDKQFEVQMMTVTDYFLYKSDKVLGADIISLPYKGDCSMLLLIPHEKKGITNLEKKLESMTNNNSFSTSLDLLMTGMFHREIHLRMPKFTLEVETDIAEVLRKIGVNSIFTMGGLTKMTDQSAKIDGIIQKAYINVDETSTEAAAATGSLVALTSVSIPYPLNADHPFIFKIVQSSSKGQYFTGRLMEP